MIPLPTLNLPPILLLSYSPLSLQVSLDVTPPEVGQATIVTTERLGEEEAPRVCQRSRATMALHFDGFTDPESGIDRWV